MKSQITAMIEIETIHEMDKICKDLGISKSEFIRAAIDEYIEFLKVFVNYQKHLHRIFHNF